MPFIVFLRIISPRMKYVALTIQRGLFVVLKTLIFFRIRTFGHFATVFFNCHDVPVIFVYCFCRNLFRLMRSVRFQPTINEATPALCEVV